MANRELMLNLVLKLEKDLVHVGHPEVVPARVAGQQGQSRLAPVIVFVEVHLVPLTTKLVGSLDHRVDCEGVRLSLGQTVDFLPRLKQGDQLNRIGNHERGGFEAYEQVGMSATTNSTHFGPTEAFKSTIFMVAVSIA